jgi:general secretion pathway protein J
MDGSVVPVNCRSDAGFTVVEVLIALALLSLLTGALFQSLRFGLYAWERTSSRASALDQNVQVQEYLRRIIAGAYPLVIMRNGEAVGIEFAGTKTSLDLVSITARARDLGGRSRIGISWKFDRSDKPLTVDAKPELSMEQTTSTATDVLMKDLYNVEFSYFGKGRSGGREWRDVWIAESYLPELVKITIRFSPGDRRVWNDMVVAPRADVDVGCVYDLLTANCRGR